MSDDLKRTELPPLTWDPESRSASLDAVFRYVIGYSIDAEQWYATGRLSKKRWGRLLRIGAILLGAAAAVLPILTQIFVKNGKPFVAPAWSSVAIALAAALIAPDYYFGFSSAWMRFMLAELRVATLRQDFVLDWEANRASWKTSGPSDDEVREMLTYARSFQMAVNSVVSDETSAWIAEFETALKRIDRSADSRTTPTSS